MGSPYYETAKPQETAFIVQPVFSQQVRQNSPSYSIKRDLDHQIEEAKGLIHAIHLNVVGMNKANVSKIYAGKFLGSGTIDRISAAVKEQNPTIVFFNHNLSPVQQRNLEKAWKVKVLDRTGLILEIFGERAQTKEGRLQVELAQLDYQKSRLVKAWTHLERQRGGTSFVGGPGESQLEIDRRLIGERIAHLKKELQKVRKTRDLGRQSRERVPYPVVALVGYTNAGKSTLFNRLTGANVFAEDLPFATLDPTMRQIRLPSGRDVILSDTVGFITDLPTHLVEAFRATLEQVQHADMILHIRDATQNDFDQHKIDVHEILSDLGVEGSEDERYHEIINKMDVCPEDRENEVKRLLEFQGKTQSLSAITGQGCDDLLKLIDQFLSRHSKEISYRIPVYDGKALSWLYDHGDIRNREQEEQEIVLSLFMDQAEQNKFEARFGYKEKENEAVS
ncbi:MAG: GTPase HflX [Pseudomonadota bacterium]